MVLDQVKFIGNAVRKQAKISHLDDCQFIAMKTEDIPADIADKIAKQYDEKFTADSDVVLFARGPIDKKKIGKIFNCVDKALGGSEDKEANANLLTDKDFKVLELGDAPKAVESQDDDSDEVSDEEIEAIVGKDEEEEEKKREEAERDPVDVHNEDVIGQALDAGKEKDDEDEVKESVNEAGLSLDDILKKGNDIAAKRQAEVDAEKAKKLEQKIKSIWIKDICIDTQNENNSHAPLEITYTDGKVEDFNFPIGTTGSDTAFKGDKEYNEYAVAGERYRQGDASYKQTLQNLKRAFARYHLEPTDEDVRIAGIRNAFNDYRIKWYYGKDKKDDPMFAFSRTEADAKVDNAKGISKLAFGQQKKAREDRGYAIYKNGNTTIYKTEAEDNSQASMIHQGKSMAQWQKQFKGEFTIPQLVRMAMSGTDLERLSTTIDGTTTLDEAKKEDDSEKGQDIGEKKDTEADKKKDEEVKEALPMKWIFLKITLKK